MTLKAWIQNARELGASDLHAEAGTPLVLRVRGELTPIGEPIPGGYLAQVGENLLGPEAWQQFLERGSADASVAIAGLRCRVNLYRTIRGIALAVRLLTPAVNGLRACNLHPELRRLTEASTGLIVISGPTGCGKSTTLAALIEEINTSRARHIITLESPLEYVFTNRRSFIRQREIPTHSPTYEQAIVDALRENPDVLVIGEMRTPEVMRLTLNAAETGHLVLATLHSATCAEALTRICMSFPAEIQGNIRAQLADCLVGIVCQRLDFLEAHRMRAPRCEVLMGNTAAKGTIRAGSFSHLANVIQAGGEDGMWTFDRYQRWMEQKKDWVRAAASVAAASEEADVAPPVTRRSAPAPRRAPLQPPAADPARKTATSDLPVRGDDPIEIPDDDKVDLAEIAELAKKIERRTP